MASLKTYANLESHFPDGFDAPEGLVAIAVFEDHEDANDAGLAVLAMGGVYWMLYSEQVYVMCVHEAKSVAVKAELEAYWALQKGGVRDVKPWPLVELSFWSFAAYALLICLFFASQEKWGLVELGRMDSVLLVARGQVWRGATALTLHRDVVHLLSNLVGGIGFFLLVCRLYGVGLGWFLVVLSGVFGNVANGFLYYPESHLSIGASTAVFGALGVLTASAIWMTLRARDAKLSLPQWILPLAGGCALLGLLGVGEGSVDVMAHFNGFLSGLVLGLAASAFRGSLIHSQRVFAVLVWLILLSAWLCGWFSDSVQSALP